MTKDARDGSRPGTATPKISFEGNDQNPAETRFQSDETPTKAGEQVGTMIWEAGQ